MDTPAPGPAAGLAGDLFPGETRIFDVLIPLPPPAVILLLGGAGLLFHFVLRSALQRWARRTATDVDDLLVEASGRVVPLWVLLGILYVGFEMLDPGHGTRARLFAERAVAIAFLASLFWLCGTLLVRGIDRWAGRNPQFQPAFAPVRFVLKAVLFVVGSVTVLAFLNVDISALLATLGVGGLAVALALKDTLENFFAGLHILADRPVSEGDWIHVHETGDRGVVLKVGWRSTRIRTGDNNVLVVPNVKLASGMITNLTARDQRVNVRVQVGVSYDSDPDRVSAVLLEEARGAVGQVPGLLGDPPPAVLLHPGFGPSSLDFTLAATVESFESGLDVQDRLRRRILRRFRAEGIRIPFPTTAVRVEREGGAPDRGA